MQSCGEGGWDLSEPPPPPPRRDGPDINDMQVTQHPAMYGLINKENQVESHKNKYKGCNRCRHMPCKDTSTGR